MDVRKYKGYKVEVRKLDGEFAFIHLVPDGENLNLYTNTVRVAVNELEPAADLRTDEQIALDEWQAETEATRMSDYPI